MSYPGLDARLGRLERNLQFLGRAERSGIRAFQTAGDTPCCSVLILAHTSLCVGQTRESAHVQLGFGASQVQRYLLAGDDLLRTPRNTEKAGQERHARRISPLE